MNSMISRGLIGWHFGLMMFGFNVVDEVMK
jgi:hypothetical protein